MSLTISERKTLLLQQVENLKNIGPNTANHKFLISFRTRLVEEGIRLDHAAVIATTIKVVLSEISEEDDFINDYAIKLAELVKAHYDMLVKHHFLKKEDDAKLILTSYFNGWSMTL